MSEPRYVANFKVAGIETWKIQSREEISAEGTKIQLAEGIDPNNVYPFFSLIGTFKNSEDVAKWFCLQAAGGQVLGDTDKIYPQKLAYAAKLTVKIKRIGDRREICLPDLLIGFDKDSEKWWFSGPNMNGRNFGVHVGVTLEAGIIFQMCGFYNYEPGAAMVGLADVSSKAHFDLFISEISVS